MSLLGNILATGASFIPGAGIFISAGIGLADKAIDMQKDQITQETAAKQAKYKSFVSSRQIPSVPDANSIMFGQTDQSMDLSPESILGKTTYFTEKFGIK